MTMTLGSVRLLSSAIRYALEGVDAVAPGSESLPTPCAGWDLRALMVHLNQSMDELRRAVAVEQADPEPANVRAAGPAATFRSHASAGCVPRPTRLRPAGGRSAAGWPVR